MLTHLSGENNSVELVHETFRSHCEDILLSVATRYEETEIFDVVNLNALKNDMRSSMCG